MATQARNIEKAAFLWAVVTWLLALSFGAGILWARNEAITLRVAALEGNDVQYRQMVGSRLTDIAERLSRIEGRVKGDQR